MRKVVRVDEQRRIELDQAAIESALGVKIASNQSVYLWAVIGGKQQLQVLSPEHDLAKLRDRYEGGTMGGRLTGDSGGDAKADVMRKLGSFLRVNCNWESGRRKFRLTLPADAVALNLVVVPGSLVFFASGELIELWRIDTWREAMAISDIREFTSRAQDVLGTDS